MRKPPKVLEKEYQNRRRYLIRARREVRDLVRNELRKLKDPHLVRAQFRKSRVKTLHSLWSKAKKKGIRSKDAMDQIKDLVGIRIVCSNQEDIIRVKDIILENPNLRLIKGSEDDLVTDPTEAGYRAYHFVVEYKVKIDKKSYKVPCEIQIRTMLQDTWASLVHRDIYKEGEDLHEDMKKLSRRLAQLISVADDIAQDIREQVSRPRTGRGRHARDKISENSIAFSFRRAFGYPPPEYIVKLVVRICRKLEVARADAIDRALMNPSIRQELEKTFQDASGWEVYEEQVFEWIPYVVAYGIDAAKKKVRREAILALEEANTIYRSELMSELPDTFDEFINRLEVGTKDDFIEVPGWITRIGTLFNATDHCAMCGTAIVDASSFTDGALNHYEIDENRNTFDHVYSLVLHSGAEVSDGGICNHCDFAMSKD